MGPRSPLLGWPTVSLRYLYPVALGPLRDDPEYRDVIREINVSWGLNPDGTLPGDMDLSPASNIDE